MVVKRFSFVLCIFLIFCLSCPVFAADNMQSDSVMFGFSYDDSPIYFCSQFLPGSNISVDSQTISVSRLYFYIPVSEPCQSLDFYLTVFKTGLPFSLNSVDYGSLSSGTYTLTASLDRPVYSTLGTSRIEGSSAYACSYKFGFSDLPFSGFSSRRFIRLTFDLSGDQKLVLWLQKNLSQNLSGVLGNPTYSFSGTNDSHFVNYFSGSFETDPVYIQGQLKSQYWDGSSVKVFSGSLLNSTSGSGGYLRIPKLTIHEATPSANSMKFHALASAVTGSLTPSSSGQDTDLEGTYLNRNYIDTVTMTATRSFDDSELIQAVNDASALNHQDLQGISDQMQEIVDHMNGLEKQGQQINGATSQETINNSSATVSNGSSSLGSMGSSVVSGAQAITNSAGSYIDFVGYGLTSLLAIGGKSNAPLYWAFVAFVFISVSFFVIRRLL